MTYNRYDFALNKWSNEPEDHYHFPQNKEQEQRISKPGIGELFIQNIFDAVENGIRTIGKVFTFGHHIK